ncbi:coiled-coil domain-containing protein [Lachnospiraceae bacterium C1.1]|nr:bZIP transcription factor [Lachnospiraceae bacterium C1.1]
MKEYLKAQSKTNEIIVGNMIGSDELNRFSKSDFRWADNRKKPFRQRAVKKGEIYQFEFGKNYIPEMSYEHRGLVIGVKQKLLYVLPIFSYDPAKHTDVYHPVDFPASKSDMFLLKSSEFSFISHDSVLKLNDIRTVSINRILYQQSGRIDPVSDTYKEIESLVLRKYFPSFLRDYEQNNKTIESLNEQVSTLTEEKETLQTENDQLKAEIESLRSQLNDKPEDPN